MVTVKELSSSIAEKLTVPLLIGASLTGAKLKELVAAVSITPSDTA